jgi:hypothetical protein
MHQISLPAKMVMEWSAYQGEVSTGHWTATGQLVHVGPYRASFVLCTAPGTRTTNVSYGFSFLFLFSFFLIILSRLFAS